MGYFVCRSFIVSFSNNHPDPERDSAAVQEFLSNMEVAFRAHSLWAGCSEEELESAGEVRRPSFEFHPLYWMIVLLTVFFRHAISLSYIYIYS